MIQITRIPCAIIALLLAGCGTAPEAMNQANNTVSLMSLYQAELANFKRVQQVRADSAKASLRQTWASVAFSDASNDAKLGVEAAANTAVPKIFTKVRPLADGFAKNEAYLLEHAERVDKELAALMQPLPDRSDTIRAAQGAVAAMGAELSQETRLKEMKDFYKTLKLNIDENRKKIDVAQAAAASVPAPSNTAVQP